MSDRLDPKDFGLKLYNRFPPSYRADDVGQKYALKRYIETAAEGGFKYVIEEQNGILDLVNPQTSPLEAVYALYEQYGLELFHGIPEEFLRSFLPNIGLAWSKKGSLDVVEFIVSSLSGIKTSTEVTYDEHDNPLITVRLEMDFSVSDYFPNAKQFERILSKFIPFYCDALLVYSYVYYENASVHGDDYSNADIKERLSDVARIYYGVSLGQRPMLNSDGVLLNQSFVLNESQYQGQDTDYCKDTIKYSGIEEVGSVGSNESSFDNVSFTPILENSTLNTLDILKDYIGFLHTEDSSVSVDEYSSDTFTNVVEEKGSLVNTGSSENSSATLNSETCFLNSTFILNGGEETERYHDTIVLKSMVESSDLECSDNERYTIGQSYLDSSNVDMLDMGSDTINEVAISDTGSISASIEYVSDKVLVVGLLNSGFVLNSVSLNETTESMNTLF